MGEMVGRADRFQMRRIAYCKIEEGTPPAEDTSSARGWRDIHRGAVDFDDCLWKQRTLHRMPRRRTSSSLGTCTRRVTYRLLNSVQQFP